jgi:hypothetical protein
VLPALVPVRMTVLTLHRRDVQVVVVPVVVPMRVLVIHGLVSVTMMVRLGRVKGHGKSKERPGNDHEERAISVAKPVGQHRPDERGERKKRRCPRGAEHALRAQVEAEAETVSDSAASRERHARAPRRPWLAKNQGDRRRENGSRDRLPEHHRAGIEIREWSRERTVERPSQRRAGDCHEPERARAASSAGARPEQDAARDHQRDRESHAPAARLSIKHPREQDCEDNFEIEKERRRESAGTLQTPREARGGEGGSQRSDEDHAPNLVAPQRRLTVLRGGQPSADRRAGIEKGRGGERSDPRAEVLHERRRGPEKARRDHGSDEPTGSRVSGRGLERGHVGRNYGLVGEKSTARRAGG